MGDNWIDPIVEEVRRAREELAARHDFDIERICRASNARMLACGFPLVSLTPNERVLTTSEDGVDENDPIVERIRAAMAQRIGRTQ